MSDVVDPQAPQFFIAEFDLADLSSHFFNQVLGFRTAAQKIGFVPHVLLPSTVNPALLAALDGRAVIDFPHAVEGKWETVPDGFTEADKQLRPLWDEIEKIGVSGNDMVMITSGRPLVIYSLGVWLGRLAADKRPTVFFRLFDHRYINLSTMGENDRSWLYRFVARDLALRPGQERVFLTLNNAQLATTLERLCCRRVFEMPLPKYYGDLPEAPAPDPGRRAIYMHLNLRSAPFLRHVFSVVREMLDKHSNVSFMLKYCLNSTASSEDVVLPSDLVGRGVELIAAELPHDDHLRTIERSDIILLPYDATEYKVLASGIFSEGAALGKVMVYPNGTWMSGQVDDGYAAGIGFDFPTKAKILTALSQALDDLDNQQISAHRKSILFRQHHSCENNLQLMRGLSRSPIDMRLTYATGTMVDFSQSGLSRGYLGRGWNSTEAAGVWSDGAEAELLLRWEPRPSEELGGNVNFTLFLVGGRGQQVEVLVNDVVLCCWRFQGNYNRAVWRSVRIPADLMASDELIVLLRFPRVSSPKPAGLSSDIRNSGVMLRALHVGAEPVPAEFVNDPVLAERWRRARWHREFRRFGRLVKRRLFRVISACQGGGRRWQR